MARAILLTLAVVGVLASSPAPAQQDRERAQLLQLQQQLQRLQSDNASMQRDLAKLREQARDADRLKKEAEASRTDLARTRSELAARSQAATQLRSEFDSAREQHAAEIEKWRTALQERDEALQAAAAEMCKAQSEIALLGGRLKAQTARGDACEVKEGQAVRFAGELVARVESNRLRLCEPVTGIWKIRNEEEIQQLRDRLLEIRGEAPAAAAR